MGIAVDRRGEPGPPPPPYSSNSSTTTTTARQHTSRGARSRARVNECCGRGAPAVESARSRNMTRGAGTCRLQDDDDDDDGYQIWLVEPAQHHHNHQNHHQQQQQQRAQRWRLSLASLLFLAVLLSEHLCFCAEAKLAATLVHLASSDLLLSPHGATLAGLGHPDAVFVGNSTTRHLWRLAACRRGDATAASSSSSFTSTSRSCFAVVDDEHLCEGPDRTRGGALNMSDLYLPFCNSYSLLDLFYGSASPDYFNCSPEALGDAARCSDCVHAYQRYDQHAQEKYEDFELLTQKYEPGPYSVRTCMEQCKMAYKPWLCAQFFPTARRSCKQKVPCHQYCLEVQQSCPFILPDNDDLIHGGSPSFICTGLLGDHPSESDAQCCDVRWDSRTDSPSGGTLKRTASSCEPEGGGGGGGGDRVATSRATAVSPRLCGGRLKICLLALALLHTVIVISASHNATLVGVAAIFSPEESAASDE